MKIHSWEYKKYSSNNTEKVKKINRKKSKKSEYDFEKDEFNFEKHNPYVVRRDLELKDDIKNYKQLAYAVNLNNFSIIISKSGHNAIMRKFGYDKHDFEGGWIFPSEQKVTFYSGALGEVSKKQQQFVANAISNELGIDLRMVN